MTDLDSVDTFLLAEPEDIKIVRKALHDALDLLAYAKARQLKSDSEIQATWTRRCGEARQVQVFANSGWRGDAQRTIVVSYSDCEPKTVMVGWDITVDDPGPFAPSEKGAVSEQIRRLLGWLDWSSLTSRQFAESYFKTEHFNRVARECFALHRLVSEREIVNVQVSYPSPYRHAHVDGTGKTAVPKSHSTPAMFGRLNGILPTGVELERSYTGRYRFKNPTTAPSPLLPEPSLFETMAIARIPEAESFWVDMTAESLMDLLSKASMPNHPEKRYESHRRSLGPRHEGHTGTSSAPP